MCPSLQLLLKVAWLPFSIHMHQWMVWLKPQYVCKQMLADQWPHLRPAALLIILSVSMVETTYDVRETNKSRTTRSERHTHNSFFHLFIWNCTHGTPKITHKEEHRAPQDVNVWRSDYVKVPSGRGCMCVTAGDSECGTVSGGSDSRGAPRWYWPLWWRKPGSPSLRESPTHFRTTAQGMKNTSGHTNTPKNPDPGTHTCTHRHTDKRCVEWCQGRECMSGN